MHYTTISVSFIPSNIILGNTDHVSCFILSHTSLGNVTLDTQKNHHTIFYRVPLWFYSAQYKKPFPVVQVFCKGLQLVLESREREVIDRDEITVETKF